MSIQTNVEEILQQVKTAAIRGNRTLSDITIIGVSKTISNDKIIEAYQTGICHFGENKVQEFKQKCESISEPIAWHFIGHLQKNKLKNMIGKTVLIHSVDSFSLAEVIHKYAENSGIIVDILIQVNVSGEHTKFGIAPQEVLSFIHSLNAFTHIRIKGLMTIAPHCENPNDIRMVFRELKLIFEESKQQLVSQSNVFMDCLSMGMSHDFEIAIEEGATMIRIGTSIFGERNYNQNFMEVKQ